MFLFARVELSLQPVLVSNVIPTAPAVPDLLSVNVQHAPRSFLFSYLDVAYQRVANPNFLTRPLPHAKLATRVAQVVIVLGLMVVWHVRVLLKFYAADPVNL